MFWIQAIAASKRTRKETEAFLRAMVPEAIPCEALLRGELIWVIHSFTF